MQGYRPLDSSIDESSSANNAVHPDLKRLTLRALSSAELAGQLSELHALVAQAIVAMAEGCDLAEDYVEMAAAVASSPEERKLVVECKTSYRLFGRHPPVVAQRCLVALDRDAKPEGLWKDLLLVLCYLDPETIDALVGAARLDEQCVPRLLDQLSSHGDSHVCAASCQKAAR